MAYCDRCERSFSNLQALEQHRRASNAHWICESCHIDFGSFDAQREHYIQSLYHHYCRECDRLFEFEESRIQHMEAKHWYCRTHDRVFRSKAALQSHYNQSYDHHFCSPCQKLFNNFMELARHNGEVHPYRVGVTVPPSGIASNHEGETGRPSGICDKILNCVIM